MEAQLCRGVLVATSGFTATGLTLNLGLNFVPTPGETYTLVANSGNAITRNFTDLANGSIVTLSYNSTAYRFLVSYEGNDGNDLVLTAQGSAPRSPAPTTAASPSASPARSPSPPPDTRPPPSRKRAHCPRASP